MTQVKNSMKVELIPGDYRYVRLLGDFEFYSDILKRWCKIPTGFVFDQESVPIIKGTNNEAGGVHDYLCRIDSDPIVTKWVAAQLYAEFQSYYDEKESGNWFNRGWDWLRKWTKTGIVIIAPGYFHKFKVSATYEEITA